MEKMNSRKYLEMAENVYSEAKEATISLLKECGKKCCVVGDLEEEIIADAMYGDVSLSVFAVGLDENGELCIAATVDNIGYGCSEDDFEQDWTDTDGISDASYPDIYRFVAENIESSMTKSKADKKVEAIFEDYYGDEEEE